MAWHGRGGGGERLWEYGRVDGDMEVEAKGEQEGRGEGGMEGRGMEVEKKAEGRGIEVETKAEGRRGEEMCPLGAPHSLRAPSRRAMTADSEMKMERPRALGWLRRAKTSPTQTASSTSCVRHCRMRIRALRVQGRGTLPP